MLIVLRPNTTREQTEGLKRMLEDKGAKVQTIEGSYRTVFGLLGSIENINADYIERLDIVESVKRITEPYKLAGRTSHPDDTVIDICGRKIGGGSFEFIAGPCSVESEEQICSVAKEVKEKGAGLLRGGAYKPRTSPYDFQGMREDGLQLLSKAKAQTGLPVVTEILSPAHLPLFDDVDVIQVGARNMQNFELLKELGKTDKPILLKRGWGNTIKELMTSAEYIMSGGNEKIIFCERGIRSFEPYTRNTLDLSAVPVIHEISHLPVVVDPSHATGHTQYVAPMALAAAACGADGILIEVHNDPCHAKCDGSQAVTPDDFADIVKKVNAIREVIL